MDKLLPINFEEDFYCKKLEELHLILNNNEDYYCVMSKTKENIIDFSFFTEKEWNTLLAISEKFEKEACIISYWSDWEYKQLSKRIKGAIYFLRDNCEFCDEGFSEMEDILGNKLEILNFIIENSSKVSITFNKFRYWSIQSWDEIEMKLSILNE